MKRICVFAGSSAGAGVEYRDAVRGLGRELVARNLQLVYGGAQVGLMGTLADTVLEEGGQVTGVIPTALVQKEVAHQDLTDLRVVASMHERKALMADLADGFIAVPGGMGTLDEICEMLTWAQLGLHAKPCGLLNVATYFRGLIEFLDHSVKERFVRAAHRAMIIVEEKPKVLLDRFARYRAPSVGKWLDRTGV